MMDVNVLEAEMSDIYTVYVRPLRQGEWTFAGSTYYCIINRCRKHEALAPLAQSITRECAVQASYDLPDI